MGFARTILAILIAISVVVLPAAGGVSIAKSAPQTAPSTVSDECDHHASSPADGSKAMDDCTCMGLCAAKCFSYAGVALPYAVLTPTRSKLEPVVADHLVVSQIGSPPFRPPRV
jgi:hypothetical protein